MVATNAILLLALSATVAQAHLAAEIRPRHLVERQATASASVSSARGSATRTRSPTSATAAPSVTGNVPSSPLASL
ncbi:hypothetical protein JCM3765_007662 [Sporobolomyces pararoseus]